MKALRPAPLYQQVPSTEVSVESRPTADRRRGCLKCRVTRRSHFIGIEYAVQACDCGPREEPSLDEVQRIKI